MDKKAVNIKMDAQIKKQAQELAKEFGMTLSGLINASLRETIRTKEVHLQGELELTDWAKEQLAEAERDSRLGYVSPAFDTVEEEKAWLKDPNAKYANGRSVRD